MNTIMNTEGYIVPKQATDEMALFMKQMQG